MLSRPTTDEELKDLVLRGAGDKIICDVFCALLISLNAQASSAKYLALAAFVCARRPHLVAALLQRPVEGCFCLGAKRAEEIINFGAAVARDSWWSPLAEPEGVRWLLEELPKLRDTIDHLLRERWEAFDRKVGSEANT
jgi:hypothetical protein